MKYPTIILASKSPRRSYLLEQAAIPFTVRTADVEEIYPDDLPALEVAPYLAKLKAKGSLHLLETEDEVLLTADSVVIIDGVIYDKPKDRAEAIATIEKMSGRMHTVVTGCCLMNRQREMVFSGVSDVYFKELSRAEIEWYLSLIHI